MYILIKINRKYTARYYVTQHKSKVQMVNESDVEITSLKPYFESLMI